MNKYEAMLILKSDLGDEDKKNLIKQIDDAVIKCKGQITSSAVWAERRKFLFPIRKFNEGTYHLVCFTAPSSTVKELKQIYRINESILRVLFTRMD